MPLSSLMRVLLHLCALFNIAAGTLGFVVGADFWLCALPLISAFFFSITALCAEEENRG